MRALHTNEKDVSSRYVVEGEDAASLYRILRSKRSYKGEFVAIITKGRDRAGGYTEIALQTDTGPTTLRQSFGKTKFCSIKIEITGEKLNSTVIYPDKPAVIASEMFWDHNLREFNGTKSHEIKNPAKMVASVSSVARDALNQIKMIEQKYAQEQAPANLAFNF